MSIRKLCSKLCKRYLKNEDGNFGAMMGVSALALLLMVGFATDTQYLTQQQAKLQSASDAIALVAFQSGEQSEAGLQAIATDYLATIYSDEDIDRVSINTLVRDGDEVRLVLAHNLDNDPAFFIPRSDVGVSAGSNAGNAGDRINFSLVLDTTVSMGTNGRIQALMTASNRLIDQLEAVDNDQFRVSVVPFSTHVNVGISNQNANWLQVPTNGTWNGCVGSRLGAQALNPNFDGSPIIGTTGTCARELLPLTDNLQQVRTRLNDLVPNGRTYLPAGLMWGWRTLTNSEPFTEAQATNVAGKEARKVMLFMTDGANTLKQIGTDHGAINLAQTQAAANIQTSAVCAAAKTDGVEIYTISLEITDATTLQLMEDCATSPAQAFDAQSESELVRAFEEIGRELGRLRLTN